MATSTMNQDIVYREATSADVESMTTIISRSFALDSPTPKMLPDTSVMRKWWSEVYSRTIQDPAGHLLLAVVGDNVVVGVFTMHSSDSKQSGILTAVPLTSDHADVMAEALTTLKQEREAATTGEPNFLVELVAVDRAYQGRGIARYLSKWACDIADQQDAAIYLNTTGAADYYTKKLDLGFKKVKDGDGQEASIVRARKSRRGVTSS